MRVVALVPAAGRGERMRRALRARGGEAPAPRKLFLPLAGRPVLQWTLEALQRSPAVEALWVAAPPGETAALEATLAAWGLNPVHVVEGGASRQESVRRLLEALPESVEWVVVHDGARPLVAPELVERVLAAALREGAAACGLPVHETVKRVDGTGLVVETVDREGLWTIQTPQAFRRDLLVQAHRQALADGASGTDDAALVERLGRPVRVVPGHPANLKVTTPDDLVRAEAWLQRPEGLATAVPPAWGLRAGFGFDVHRLAPGRPLILGGVTIPWERGLVGHSDGDALSHAIADALLGAAGLGDLGGHFPDDDPAFAGAYSLGLLRRVVEAVDEAGLQVVAVDATILAQEPRLAPYVPAMVAKLREVLGAQAEVNVKATRPEGLGALGRAEGIAAFCVAICAPRVVG